MFFLCRSDLFLVYHQESLKKNILRGLNVSLLVCYMFLLLITYCPSTFGGFLVFLARIVPKSFSSGDSNRCPCVRIESYQNGGWIHSTLARSARLEPVQRCA